MSQPPFLRAWHCKAYGGPEVLRLVEAALPVPGPEDLLVAVEATTVESADVRIRTQHLPPGFGPLGRLAFGFRRPRQPILGTVLAGRVLKGARGFREGERILASTGVAMGCHQDHRLLGPRASVLRLAEELSFEAAVSLPFGGLAALHFLRKAGVRAGERVMILGAAGSVGSACVQLARVKGAEVHGTTSPSNRAWLETLGATGLWDREGWIEAGTFDVIVDAVGASRFEACVPHLRERGRYVALAGGLLEQLPRFSGSCRRIAGVAPERTEDLQHLVDLALQGRVRPTPERIFAFEELPAAHAYVESGHKRGTAVVRVGRM